MSSQHAALLVDADATGLESLVYGFQAADWRVTACPTPGTASLLVNASGADVVVLAVRREPEKSAALVERLRATAGARRMAILVLATDGVRESIGRADNTACLSLPAWVRDVVTAGQLLAGGPVDAAAGGPNGGPDEETIAFQLSPSVTASLLRTMAQLGRSGTLHFERKNRQADIAFQDGDVVQAQVGQREAMPAVQQILSWNQGSATVQLRPVTRRKPPFIGARDFVEELDRFQRDLTHALKGVGALRAVCTCDQERLRQSASDVLAEVTPVSRLCDGQRSLADILDESPFRVLDTAAILARLAGLGVLMHADATADDDGAAKLEALWQGARVEAIDGSSAVSAASTSSGSLATVQSAASSGALPVAPFAPAPSELVSLAAAEAAAAAASPRNPVAQTSGTIELPSRRSQSGLRALPARSSVVIDAVMDDAPVTSIEVPKASTSATELVAERSGVRVTGEIQVAVSRKSTTLPVARASIQLDAALGDPAGAPASTAPAVQVPAKGAGHGTTTENNDKPSRKPTPLPPGSGRQGSGHFSPLEKDFFAREADLYKDEGSESFADLDNPASRAGKNGKAAKNGAGKRK